jgi:hypothetical protein
MSQSATNPQVLAWETTQSGYSFQYTSDDRIVIEHDKYLQPNQSTLPGQVIVPFTDIETLERLIANAKAIKNGEMTPTPPALSIAS